MDASKKPVVHLVEPTGKRPIREKKSKEASLRPSAEDQYRTASERRAEGKALRDDVPREAHAGWKPPKDRRDPVDLLLETNEGRLPELLPIRHGRMVSSPFAFFRGSAALMAADLANTPRSGLKVQACGDAHLLNFGGFATPERNIIFDINDFDETLPGPWEWDLKRLAASAVIAGRHLRLSDNDSARAAIATVRSYRERMTDYASMRALEVWYDRIDVERFLKEVPKRRGTQTRRTTSRKGAQSNRCRARLPEDGGTSWRAAPHQGQPTADLPPHCKTSTGSQKWVSRRARSLPRVAARACPCAVRPLPLLRLGNQGGRRG